jgi:hypothetical protein
MDTPVQGGKFPAIVFGSSPKLVIVLSPSGGINHKLGEVLQSVRRAIPDWRTRPTVPWTMAFCTNMTIYFGFTVAGNQSGIATARRVVRLLEDLLHEVLTRHLASDSAWEADRLISPQDIWRDMAWLDQCPSMDGR